MIRRPALWTPGGSDRRWSEWLRRGRHGPGGGAPAGDPYWDNVVLLARADGADGATTFTDLSPVARTLTAAGNAQLDTAQAKFGTASALFDGTDDGVTAPNSADFDFGTGSFTVEAFIRLPSAWNTANQRRWVASKYDTNNQRSWACALTTSGAGSASLEFTYSTAGTSGTNFQKVVSGGAGGLPSNQWTGSVWHHVCWERSGNFIRMYINGEMIGTAQNIAGVDFFDANSLLGIGCAQASGAVATQPMNGWIDEMRITKNVARYDVSGTFTVPTAAFPTS